MPISFLFIPYAYWRMKTHPWYGVFIRPLAIIFIAWVAVVFLSAWIPPTFFVSFALIVWQSFVLKASIDEKRPDFSRRREDWQR